MLKLNCSKFILAGLFVFINIAEAQETNSGAENKKSALDQLPISQKSGAQSPSVEATAGSEVIPPALIAPLHLAGMPELDERLLASTQESVVAPVAPTAEVEVVEEVKSPISEPEIEGQLKVVQ